MFSSNVVSSPAVGAALIRAMALRILLAVSATLLLCQCGSTQAPSLGSGESYLDATPDRKNRDRIIGQSIVAVNGKRMSAGETRLPAGQVDVEVSFSWPQGGKSKVPLRFYAAEGSHHVVSYRAFPPSKRKGEASFGEANGNLLKAAFSMSYFGIPLVPVAMVSGTTKLAAEALASGIPDGNAATHVDVAVISSHQADGIVRFARVFPDGRVETKAWDSVAKMRP